MAISSDSHRILTKEDIWGAQDIEESFVPVPEWGRTPDGEPKGVVISTFSKRKADEIKKRATRRNPQTRQDELDNDLLEPLLFVEGIIAPDLDLEDFERIKEKSAVVYGRILKAILDASGMTEAAAAAADKSAEDRPDAPVRVSIGARPEDDARGAAAQDVNQRVRVLDRVVPA